MPQQRAVLESRFTDDQIVEGQAHSERARVHIVAVEVGQPIHQVRQLVLQEPIEIFRERRIGAGSDLRRVPFFFFFVLCFFLFPFKFLFRSSG